MTGIRLENIKKLYGQEVIFDRLNLMIDEGKIFALLGPSGCGKTTLLRLLAGFETVDAGSIYLGEHDITHVPIHERRINTVFQQYALFPHLNVFDNVAYGLRAKKMPADVIESRVMRILKTVSLDAQVRKSIQQLSGGQQQRVALARAIVNEPDVLLLDEPLAALDFNLKERMLLELIELQDRFKMTFVYVTHDQLEALTIADQMAIMNAEGEIEQIGTPKQIYEFPQSSFVAQFVGTTNILRGTVRVVGSHVELHIPGIGAVVIEPGDKSWIVDGRKAVLSLRPEKIAISKKQLAGFSNSLTGIVEAIVYQGRSTQYKVRLPHDVTIQVFEQNEEHFPVQVIDYYDEVYLYWQKENAMLMEK